MQERNLLEDMFKRQKNDLYYDFGTGINVPKESANGKSPFLQGNTVKSEAPPQTETVKKENASIKKDRSEDTYNPKKRDAFLEGFNGSIRKEKSLFATSFADWGWKPQSRLRKKENASSIPEMRLGGDIGSDEEYEAFIEAFKAESRTHMPNTAKETALSEEEKLNLREAKRSVDYSMRPEERTRRMNQAEAQILPKYEPKSYFLTKYESSESLQEINSGENYRDANFWDLMVNSAKRGYYNDRYGQELYKQMLGQQNEAEKYREILSGEDYRFKDDGFFESRISKTFGKGGKIWSRLSEKDIINAIGTGAAAGTGIALATGQAGPQVLLPEEVLTVPAAAGIGAKIGADAANNVKDYRVNAGHMYNELLAEGVSPNIAREFALGTEAVNAIIRFVPTEEIMKVLKGLQKAEMADVFLEKIREELISRGVDFAKEKTQNHVKETGFDAARKKMSER